MSEIGLKARIERIKATVSIFDVLDAVGKRADHASTHQIKCPVHRDKTPSARVYAETNHIFCFRCAKSWDVVALVAEIQRTTTPDACSWLETRFALAPMGTISPQLVGAALAATVRPDFSESVKELEKLIQSCRDSMGANHFHKAWIALDLAQAAYGAGGLDVQGFVKTLADIRKFASVAMA